MCRALIHLRSRFFDQCSFSWFWRKLLVNIVFCTRLIKVACVVKTIFFMDWFYCDLITLMKKCKMPYKNLDKALFFFEKPGILPENLKTLTSSNYPTVQYFLLKLRTRFLLTNVYKSVCGIFFISLRSWVICKNLKRPGFYTLVFYTFINNSRSKRNKKNRTHPFVDITK